MAFKQINESDKIEYKAELPKNNVRWLKTIVSFSNTSGGKLYVGIDDKSRDIIGLKEDVSFMEQKVYNVINESIKPRPNIDVKFQTIEGKVVMVISVDRGIDTPYFLIDGNKKQVYTRFGSTDRIANKAQIYELNRNSNYEGYLKELYIENGKQIKINSSELDEFVKYLNNLSYQDKQVNADKLIHWGIIKKSFETNYKTNGYNLLTNNSFSQAVIKVGLFKGEDKSELLKDKLITGNIINQYYEGYDYISELLEDGYYMGKKKSKKYKIPRLVIREILANAIVHRDYYEKQPIMISIFGDRIEFFSPGSLYGGITKEEVMNEVSKLRNISIGEIFNFIGISEGWGSGLSRVRNELSKEGYKDFVFDSESGPYINVIIYFNKDKSVLNLVNQTLTRENFLDYQKEFRRRDLEEMLEITEHQARRLIENWVEEGKVLKVGDKSATKYIVYK